MSSSDPAAAAPDPAALMRDLHEERMRSTDYFEEIVRLRSRLLAAEARADAAERERDGIRERCARVVERYYRTVPYDLGTERQIVIRDLAKSIRALPAPSEGEAKR